MLGPPIARLRITLVAAILALSVATAPGCRSDTSPPRSHGLTEEFTLGAALVVSAPDYGTARTSLDFKLPDDAVQGPDYWYVLDALIEISVNPGVMSGRDADRLGYVAVATNGLAAATIGIHPFSDEHGQTIVRWETAEVFRGQIDAVTESLRFTVPHRNYLQVRGVKGGDNRLSIAVEHLRGDVIESATLLPGSRIVRTTRPPVRLDPSASSRGSSFDHESGPGEPASGGVP